MSGMRLSVRRFSSAPELRRRLVQGLRDPPLIAEHESVKTRPCSADTRLLASVGRLTGAANAIDAGGRADQQPITFQRDVALDSGANRVNRPQSISHVAR